MKRLLHHQILAYIAKMYLEGKLSSNISLIVGCENNEFTLKNENFLYIGQKVKCILVKA